MSIPSSSHRPALTRMRLFAMVSATALISASAVFAADAPAAPGAEANVSEVVVTGSRIVRDGYDAPTPTTVVGVELLEKKAPPTLIDALSSLPAFKNVASPATVGATVSGTGGQSFVNLRGIGANRTLVLLDGQRVIPSTAIGTVDLAILPSALIERVDVVTGGASAAWGSDAVSGVVNLVLTRSLNGWKGDVQAGVSDYGDAGYRKASLAYGGQILGGRGRIIASGEYYKGDGALPRSRPYNKYPLEIFTNPAFTATNGQFRRLLVPYAYYATATVGGLINAGPLRGLRFAPDGSVSNFTFGTIGGATQVMAGPDEDLSWTNAYSYVLAPQSRGTAFMRASYDITPNMTATFDALYGQTETQGWSATPNTVISGNYTIQRTNAFLSADLKARMDAARITSFTLGRVSNDLGPSIIDRLNKTYRVTGGLSGSFGEGWTYKAYGEYGENSGYVSVDNNAIRPNLTKAIDAVVSPSGQIVCRSTLTAPGDGCVPINLFGFGAPSAAAKAYVMGNSRAELDTYQAVGGLSVSGEPFKLPAGPVSLIAGIEARRDAVEQTVDPQSQAGDFALSNPKALNGSNIVKEAFGEIVVPLIHDQPLFKSLDLNGAARYTDNRLGGQVTTWKAGLSYAMFDDLRFRLTRSHDIRAPNLLELKTTAIQQSAQVSDPVLNITSSFQSVTRGNPDLIPETADTTAAGVVYRPSWFPGFSASVDYYQIRIEDQIATISLQEIVTRCQSGNTDLCALITRDPTTRVITGIVNPYLNLQSVEANGYDLDFSYRTPLSRFFDSLPGDLRLRALGSYVGKIATNDGVTSIDRAGSLNQGQPRWTWNMTAGYQLADFSTSFEFSYVGGGKYDTTFLLPTDFDHPEVDSRLYVNWAGDYTFHIQDVEYQAYFAINNLANTNPPIQFSSGGSLYDRTGRAYRVGLRFKF